MWVLATGETELLLEITLHEWVGANGGEETSIDCLLIGLALLRGLKINMVVRGPLISFVRYLCGYTLHI